MTRLLILVALVWAALMPPLFTHGACTAEYEQASALVTRPENRPRLATPDAAVAFLQAQQLDVHKLTEADCEHGGKPRWLQQCPSGTIVWTEAPVRNRVCSIYRDDKTVLRLRYDLRDRLVGVVSEMAPFKYLPLPWGGSIDWAK
ncbi:hypothetical protein SNE35_20620 [Paucibacter sp. R3-3]|uniref:DUF3019 domain-containing protein n=1 Tax=Roseateles agri TaxID=3098619 RepID=A0ABU5DKU9_9BURK|nr:hypothetical protein [Paucibacter sp. R3-3]MDY0746929.1 hypothetical protein [Paucibacter sp. R3-3]